MRHAQPTCMSVDPVGRLRIQRSEGDPIGAPFEVCPTGSCRGCSLGAAGEVDRHSAEITRSPAALTTGRRLAQGTSAVG